MEQLERVERYLERIRGIYHGQPHYLLHKKCYEDDVITFFIHCHHLGDWIVKLNKVGESKEAVNAFINSHAELKVCADLCNRSKHCKIERVRSDARPHLCYRSWSTTTFTPASQQPVVFKSSYRVLCGNVTYDALALAEACYALWSEYVGVLQRKYTSQLEA